MSYGSFSTIADWLLFFFFSLIRYWTSHIRLVRTVGCETITNTPDEFDVRFTAELRTCDACDVMFYVADRKTTVDHFYIPDVTYITYSLIIAGTTQIVGM